MILMPKDKSRRNSSVNAVILGDRQLQPALSGRVSHSTATQCAYIRKLAATLKVEELRFITRYEYLRIDRFTMLR